VKRGRGVHWWHGGGTQLLEHEKVAVGATCVQRLPKNKGKGHT